MNRLSSAIVYQKRAVHAVAVVGAVLLCALFVLFSAQLALASGAAQETPGEDGPGAGDSSPSAEGQDFTLFLPAVGNKSESFGYGLQAHMVTRSQAERSMVTISYLDFTWAKQQINWGLYRDPWTGEISYGVMDQLVVLGMRNEINLLFSVTSVPAFLTSSDGSQTLDPVALDSAAYARFVGRVARRYCGTSLKAIEVWNEPNLQVEWVVNREPNPEEYVEMLALAYQAIKEECPSMKVISAGLAQTSDNLPVAMDNFVYLERMLQAGLLNYVDAVGAHALGYNVPPWVRWEDACTAIQVYGNTFTGPCDTPHHSWSFRSTLEGYRERLVAFEGDKIPVWVTEFGWAAGGAYEPGYEYANDNDYYEQADWTVDAFAMMREFDWVETAFLWNLNFRMVADQTQKAQWGIVEPPDWHPLPVFKAINRLNTTGRKRPTLDDLAALDATLKAAETREQTAPVHVPEPVTLVLMATGLASLAGYTYRQRRREKS